MTASRIPDANRFDGRVAIVTGAGRGIGRAVALLLAERGASVVVNDLGTTLEGEQSGDDVAADVVGEITAAGGKAIAHTETAATMAGADSMVTAALDSYGRVDVLVNNAGIMRDRSFLEMDEDAWDDVIAVNLRAAFCCTRVAAADMAARRHGRIVNMSSIAAFGKSGISSQIIGRANYSAAKAGLLGLTWALAGELASLGITCNAVMPTATTRLMLAARDRRAEAGISTPEAGLVERDPMDVAHLVAALTADAAATISGRAFWIDRGLIRVYDPPAPTTSFEEVNRWTLDDLVAALPSIPPPP